jgi:hypothetical protein
MFMPQSSEKQGWRINNIDAYFWYASYKSNVFYIATRIGTNCEYYLKDISDRINEIQNIKLPKGHIIRLRAVYFDDKYTNYRLYRDYLIPKTDSDDIYYIKDDVEEVCIERIIDGIYYEIDLMSYKYIASSDNFDKDHQSYYSYFISNFKCGYSREGQRKYVLAKKEDFFGYTDNLINENFDKLILALKKVNFIKLLKCTNSRIEFIDQFSENFS